MRGTLKVLLKGTKPITGNFSEPICGCVCWMAVINSAVSALRRKSGFSVTGICADSSGRPLVRINMMPARRVELAPPKLRSWCSTLSAVWLGCWILALLTTITLASRACASEAFKSSAKLSWVFGSKPSTIIRTCCLAIWRCRRTASSSNSSCSPRLICCKTLL